MTKWYADDHGQALDWGRRYVEENGGRIYMTSVYGRGNGRPNLTFLATADYLHLFPGRQWSGFCERALGWYFGGGCGWMEDEPEGQALLEAFLVPPFFDESQLEPAYLCGSCHESPVCHKGAFCTNCLARED